MSVLGINRQHYRKPPSNSIGIVADPIHFPLHKLSPPLPKLCANNNEIYRACLTCRCLRKGQRRLLLRACLPIKHRAVLQQSHDADQLSWVAACLSVTRVPPSASIVPTGLYDSAVI